LSKANADYISELRAQDPFTGYRVPIEETGGFAKVRFVMRGEWAFYEAHGRATLLEAFAGRGLIHRGSIERWDDGSKISEADRDVIVEHVSAALRSAGNDVIRVV